MKNYWYYDGFIYDGNDIICELFGTEKQKEIIGREIVRYLDDKTTDKILFFGLGLFFCSVVYYLMSL